MNRLNDHQAIGLFLDMIRTERGAAGNTLNAYGHALRLSSSQLKENMSTADTSALRGLLVRWNTTDAIARTTAAIKEAA